MRPVLVAFVEPASRVPTTLRVELPFARVEEPLVTAGRRPDVALLEAEAPGRRPELTPADDVPGRRSLRLTRLPPGRRVAS